MMLKFTEKLEIARFLETVTHEGDDKCRRYNTGWTDKRVAGEFAVTPYIVSSVRSDIYPNWVRGAQKATSPSNLEAKLAELEQRIAILERSQANGHEHDNLPTRRTLNTPKPVQRWDQ